MANTRHKKPNKRSIAAKKRWANVKGSKSTKLGRKLIGAVKEAIKKTKAGDYDWTIKTPRKGYSSPSDIVARMTEKDELFNTTKLFNDVELNPSAQTRLDIIYHDLEQAMKDVITKLKAMF